jgi:predicted metal-binding protein
MSDSGTAGRATITVCITCRAAGDPIDSPRAGTALANATAAAAAGVSDILVQRVRCLGNCNRGLSAAIRCDNAWTYVFGGLEPARDGSSLIIGAQLLAQASDGIMPWRGRPDSLKRGLIARVPPPNFPDELP